MQSPFITHRAKVLGHYSTANWLQGVVMALWSGNGNPVGLSQLTNTDAEHFAAFQEMVAHYRRVGENDPALHALVQEIEQRQRATSEAEEREKEYEPWSQDAARELRRLGKDAGLIDDRYNWFNARFDAGDTPEAAAAACQPLPALND